MSSEVDCDHTNVECLNHYELVRKYRCVECDKVMICSCNKEFAEEYLPHQTSHATVAGSRRRIPVTLGYVEGICRACRGLPEEPHPKAELYGREAKYKRYYWREIARETIRRFADWAKQHSYDTWTQALVNHQEKYEAIEDDVAQEILKRHQENPKYSYDEPSQKEILTEHSVDVVDVQATYVAGSHGGILRDGAILRPESYALAYFGEDGYTGFETESRPFHVLFGLYLWMLIQDPSDPRTRTSGFGDRKEFDAGRQGEMIWTPLPEDFGSPQYAERRSQAVQEHFSILQNASLSSLFDYWLEPSANLRQYLWAHRKKDIRAARRIVDVLPSETILAILRFLAEDYYGRYLGWPDLLLYQENEYLFAEVKSSNDSLTLDQKNWIRENDKGTQLPFKLIKLHRSKAIEQSQLY